MLELIKAIIIGVIEGITEWLPISSTGHMILAEEWIHLNVSKEFNEMFLVVIQLGAILAVCIIFFERLYPFSKRKSPAQRQETFNLWGKVIVGCIPAGILGVLFNDWFDAHFYNSFWVATMLIVYGILFILLEHHNRKKSFAVRRMSEMSYMQALIVGCFQCLALIPGTSRSGATILGAMIIGIARPVAAEFSFFLAAPIMFGASLLKVVKFLKAGIMISTLEIGILVVGSVVAFIVSMAAIQFLMDYVRKHDFSIFGYYRIILGILVLGYFLVF